MTRQVVLIFLVLLLIAAGLGFYALHLKEKVAAEEQRLAQQPQLVAPPASGPTSTVTLYLASDIDGALRRSQVQLALPQERSERARAILRGLLASYAQPDSRHRVGTGADIRDVFLLPGGTAIIDATAGFADTHPSGVLAEQLSVASLVMTMTANDPQINRIKILVDGKERETLAGHADLRRFYEAGEVSQSIKEMP